MTHRSIRTLIQTSIKTTKYTIKHYFQLGTISLQKKMNLRYKYKIYYFWEIYPRIFFMKLCHISELLSQPDRETLRDTAAQSGSDFILLVFECFVFSIFFSLEEIVQINIFNTDMAYTNTPHSSQIVLLIPWSIIQFLLQYCGSCLYKRKLY